MRTRSARITLMGAMLLGLWSAAFVVAQDQRENDKQIDKLRQEVKELVKAGKSEDADRVERQIARLQEERAKSRGKEAVEESKGAQAKQRLVELQRRLAELKEKGRYDEAEQTARQIEAIRKSFEVGAPKKGEALGRAPASDLEVRLGKMKQRIAELKEAGRNDEADRLAEEAHALMRQAMEKKDRKTAGYGGEIQERVAHLRQAARHLEAAGLHDLATNVMEQSEKMARSAQAERQDYADVRDDGAATTRRVDELAGALREMREQMERMQQQIRELNQKNEKR